jgi:hypothetical protein
MVCVATSLSGTYSTDYTNVIQITMETGQKFTINQPAHFKSVGYTKAYRDCHEMLIKDLPSGGHDAKEIGSPTKRAVTFSA